MNDEQKAAAAANKKAMAEDAEKFKSEHADRVNAVSEFSAAAAPAADAAASESDAKKNDEGGSTIWFWGLLIVLVAGLGYVLVRKDNKK